MSRGEMKPANDNLPLPQRAANDNLVTSERLRSALSYDAETGHFTWLVRIGSVKAGQRAGKHAKNGYWRIRLDGVEYPAHRLAWFYVYGRWPDGQVDHINLDKIDNGISNLRPATNAENQRNRSEQSNNTSGFKGVSRFKKTGRWRAEIMIDGHKKYLGSFSTPEQAAVAYDSAAARLHGDFARNAIGRLAANDNEPFEEVA